jgi:hypothetical protein
MRGFMLNVMLRNMPFQTPKGLKIKTRGCVYSNPKGVAHQSPGLRVFALPWESMKKNSQPQRGCTLLFHQQNPGVLVALSFQFDNVQPRWG